MRNDMENHDIARNPKRSQIEEMLSESDEMLLGPMMWIAVTLLILPTENESFRMVGLMRFRSIYSEVPPLVLSPKHFGQTNILTCVGYPTTNIKKNQNLLLCHRRLDFNYGIAVKKIQSVRDFK